MFSQSPLHRSLCGTATYAVREERTLMGVSHRLTAGGNWRKCSAQSVDEFPPLQTPLTATTANEASLIL